MLNIIIGQLSWSWWPSAASIMQLLEPAKNFWCKKNESNAVYIRIYRCCLINTLGRWVVVIISKSPLLQWKMVSHLLNQCVWRHIAPLEHNGLWVTPPTTKTSLQAAYYITVGSLNADILRQKLEMCAYNPDIVSFLLKTENFCRQTSRTVENQEGNANFTVPIEQ